ncbi:MAG: transglutaminase domain-containing protein [Chloroflexota bacterium]
MAELARRFLKPREGWLAFFLLCVMLLSLTWSVQSAAWLNLLDFVMPVALWGAVLGVVLALLPISVAIVIPVSALLGGLVVLWAVAGEYFPLLDQAGRLLALHDEALGWLRTVLIGGYPIELTPYAIGLGLLTWTTGFIAAYTMYRHHRVTDAVVVVGIALLVNMSATYADLFFYLVLFVLAALLLLLRSSLVKREEGWQSRRVNENVDVPISIMRAGITFIAISIIGAWVLTSVAVAAPLTDAWRNLDGIWSGVAGRLDGVFGSLTNPEARLSGTSFGSEFTVRGEWVSNDEPVLTLRATRPYYLRTTTYDTYTGSGWSRSDGTTRPVAPEQLIFPGDSPERPSPDAAEAETITVNIDGDVGRNVFYPGFADIAYFPVNVYEPAGQPLAGGIQAAGPLSVGQGYQMRVALTSATESELAGAGTAYPAAISALYLDDSRATDAVRSLARQVMTDAGAEDPYAMAKALAAYLSDDDSFSYDTEPGPPDPTRDLVDYFLDPVNRTGFCEYYASAMALMARSLGLPARVAVGFAPGERIEPGVTQVRERNAHAWAEIFFPGYGWQIFEATKTIDSQFVRIPGAGVGTPLPITDNRDFLGAFEEGETSVPAPSFVPAQGGYRAGEAPPVDAARGANLVVLLALGVVAALLAWWTLRRRGRRIRILAPGERAWQRLALAAGRAGVNQRPSETFYEYSAWLEEQIPNRRPEIRMIADGKVQQAYSGKSMTDELIGRIERAWERLRLPLVWLAARRTARSLFRRRPG